MERLPPDGYRWIDGGPAIELVDPDDCPAGHPMQLRQRGYAPCTEHRGHPTWTCQCGQIVYGVAGAFVGALSCR